MSPSDADLERIGLEPLLEVSHLSILYGRQGLIRKRQGLLAVDDVSFSVYRSEAFSLVGESGSGKTSIARAMAALTPASSGSIKYKGTEVSKLRGSSLKNYRKEVQLIFQDPYASLNPREDAFTAISTPLQTLLGEKDPGRLLQEVSRLCREVGLVPEEVMYKLPHQLSGGERQRVNIARALASDPQLIVADEPVTMLDASQRGNILSLLLRLKQERNLTIILITHDLASAEFVGGRTGIIYMGKLVELGPTNRVLARPSHPYTELILAATPTLALAPREEREEVRSAEARRGLGCVFTPRCRYATDLCRQAEPELLAAGEHHAVACHHKLDKE